MLFKKRKNRIEIDQTDDRFQKMVELVWDLDRKEFNKLHDAIKLVWQGYDRSRSIKTNDEKEMEEIDSADKQLEFMETDESK